MRINYKWVKGAAKWFDRHPFVASLLKLLSIVVVFLPQAITAVWALVSNEPFIPSMERRRNGFQLPHFSATWVTAPLGFGMLIVIAYLLLTGRRSRSVNGPKKLNFEWVEARMMEIEIASDSFEIAPICYPKPCCAAIAVFRNTGDPSRESGDIKGVAKLKAPNGENVTIDPCWWLDRRGRRDTFTAFRELNVW